MLHNVKERFLQVVDLLLVLSTAFLLVRRVRRLVRRVRSLVRGVGSVGRVLFLMLDMGLWMLRLLKFMLDLLVL